MNETIGDRAAAMLAKAATISEPGPGVTRLPFTPEHAHANDLIAGWMQAAGLDTHRDAAGTLIGRREGATPDAPTFLLGSHQDSVRGGGAYDGIMGVLLPVLALEQLHDTPLPFAVEVLCFADEEGVRFPTALIGPRALAGTLDPAVLDMADRSGLRLGEALEGFGDPAAIGSIARAPGSVMGYLETHIEQGPVLEAEDLPVGIVTAIAGIERHAVTITGRAAHAGTAPMTLRKDALCAAAELVTGVERICGETENAVGTIGHLEVAPNVVNAVPAEVVATIELRSAEDVIRAEVASRVAEVARQATDRRGCALRMERTYQQPAKACAPELQDALEAAVAATGVRPLRLMSGATHDASAIADLCPMAMLFVRCREGVSHHPDEYAAPEDMGCAVGVLVNVLRGLAATDTQGAASRSS
ncbi:M20 family metallo-hydrolase [Tropicimonas sp. IMCC6043]|uniref:M20 family metallo-hydrolase n=1 Tax=Tropicimonas sp. IMCC6043 TaxID=2510645 RepID=UPI00101BEBC9|nr:M20 family metallo-hydrolase [Tropicimonas sp. IMCC6043]RYH11555.1 Zn-dependent hydrolase [Tropicimonas sp. IMCC6043]